MEIERVGGLESGEDGMNTCDTQVDLVTCAGVGEGAMARVGASGWDDGHQVTAKNPWEIKHGGWRAGCW